MYLELYMFLSDYQKFICYRINGIINTVIDCRKKTVKIISHKAVLTQ